MTRVALVGCGVVGQSLLALLDRQREDLGRRHGVSFEVVGVAVRDPSRDRGPLARRLPRWTDPVALVGSGVDLVVEVAGGRGPVGDAVRAALAQGIPVVTANKALLAAELGPLVSLARETGAALACEAAAAGAIPILHALGRRIEGVRRLRGVVNGTCNYALTRLHQDGQALHEALAGARRLGFAEEDATADIDGHDAAAKACLLVYRAWGLWARPGSFPVTGIRAITLPDVQLAERLGLRIRHLVVADAHPDGVSVEVCPALLPAWHLLAGVEEEYNAVYLETESAGDLGFFGRGAGGAATATEVLADMVDAVAGRTAAWTPPVEVAPLDPARVARRWFVRQPAEDALPKGVEVLSEVRHAGARGFVVEAIPEGRLREALGSSARAWSAPLVS